LSELNQTDDVAMDAKDIFKYIYTQYVDQTDLSEPEKLVLHDIMRAAAGTGDASSSSALEVFNRLSMSLGGSAAAVDNTYDRSRIASVHGSVIRGEDGLTTTFEHLPGITFEGTTPDVYLW
jgi:hypothetical protein